MSGGGYQKSCSEVICVKYSFGRKFQKGTPDQQRRAYKTNSSRSKESRMKAQEISLKILKLLRENDFINSKLGDATFEKRVGLLSELKLVEEVEIYQGHNIIVSTRFKETLSSREMKKVTEEVRSLIEGNRSTLFDS